jgi:plastocyanin
MLNKRKSEIFYNFGNLKLGFCPMKHIFSLSAALFFAMALAVTAPAQAGTITGTVVVHGLRTPENILIYFGKAQEAPADLTHARFSMDQQNLTFIPHVLPIVVGAAVAFPNNDKVAHNVFSLSQAKKFNLGSYGPGMSKTVVFDQPGMVELRCDVHAEMLAYIAVLKSPYFGITDASGHFTIPDTHYLETHGVTGIPPLPAGDYLVKSWHEKLQTGKTRVTVPAEGTVNVTLDLHRGAPSVLYK